MKVRVLRLKKPNLLFSFAQDNEISDFKRGTFHSQANPSISILDLSFNFVDSVERDAFRFPELTRLLLNDNAIKNVGPRAFVEMTKLQVLSLEGNKVGLLNPVNNEASLWALISRSG